MIYIRAIYHKLNKKVSSSLVEIGICTLWEGREISEIVWITISIMFYMILYFSWDVIELCKLLELIYYLFESIRLLVLSLTASIYGNSCSVANIRVSDINRYFKSVDMLILRPS